MFFGLGDLSYCVNRMDPMTAAKYSDLTRDSLVGLGFWG